MHGSVQKQHSWHSLHIRQSKVTRKIRLNLIVLLLDLGYHNNGSAAAEWTGRRTGIISDLMISANFESDCTLFYIHSKLNIASKFSKHKYKYWIIRMDYFGVSICKSKNWLKLTSDLIISIDFESIPHV